jgi:hypothetical protein
MKVVLSGTAGVVRSGTAESSYGEPDPTVSGGNRWPNLAPTNDANKESFGLLLTETRFSIGRAR